MHLPPRRLRRAGLRFLIFCLAGFTPLPGNSAERDVAPEIVATLLRFQPMAVRPETIEPILSTATVRSRDETFDILIEGDHYAAIRALLREMCGPPTSEKPGENPDHLVACFPCCTLVVARDENYTAIFGFGRPPRENESVAPRNQPPRPLSGPKPTYPISLKAQGIEGRAVIGFVVDTTGAVRDAYIVKETKAEFGVAALQSIVHWRYLPALENGRPVNRRVQMPFVFSIEGKRPLRPMMRERQHR